MKKLIPSLLTILLAAGIILYGQRAADYVLASSFQPEPDVTAIDTRLQLTPMGSRLLKASRTEIQDATTFNQSCHSTERTAAILGCYYKKHIYLFDITNPELDGATEVTAAHEILHAAYERLTFFERFEIDSLIEAEYERHKNDPGIAKDMEYYQKAEPGAEINELHSILGTTIRTIDPKLESYYARYFTNRTKIVELNDRYNEVFDDLTQKAEQLQSEISAQEKELSRSLQQYEIDRQQLETDIQTFNDRASSRGFSNQSSFNTARSALVSRVSEMNQRRSSINASVATYNAKIAELNRLSVKVNEISKSINGVQAPSGV